MEKKVARLTHVDQVMPDTPHLFGCDFSAAQVQAAKYLPRIRRNDLAAVAQGQFHPQAALAGRIGARNDNQLWQHVHSPIHPSF